MRRSASSPRPIRACWSRFGFNLESGQALEAVRRIAHLDMDMFFAGVELLRYPELRGLPMVVGGRSAAPQLLPDGSHSFCKLRDYVGRGVVTTSTYEARALGVFSAMGMMQAARLAPDAVLLPANFDAYRHYSRLFKQAVATVAPLIAEAAPAAVMLKRPAISKAPVSQSSAASSSRAYISSSTRRARIMRSRSPRRGAAG